MSKIEILRLGHRPVRDERVSTHVGLVSRAFGADEITIVGKGVKKVRESIEKVNENWGGSLSVKEEEKWKNVVRKWEEKDGQIIHLTMYGENINEKMDELEEKDTLVIVGAEKVPWEVYEKADHNIAVGNQPHSEIAALAVFLDRLQSGKELNLEHPNAKKKIIPQKKGKKVKDLND